MDKCKIDYGIEMDHLRGKTRQAECTSATSAGLPGKGCQVVLC